MSIPNYSTQEILDRNATLSSDLYKTTELLEHMLLEYELVCEDLINVGVVKDASESSIYREAAQWLDRDEVLAEEI